MSAPQRPTEPSRSMAYTLEAKLLGVTLTHKPTAVNPMPLPAKTHAKDQDGRIAYLRDEVPRLPIRVPRVYSSALLQYVIEDTSIEAVAPADIEPDVKKLLDAATSGRADSVPDIVFRVNHSGTATHQKEVARRAKEFGTVLAFHGSHTHNWYPILKCGLRNTSGSHGDTGGALFGHGIYLSSSLHVSQDFSNFQSSQHWPSADSLAALPSDATDVEKRLATGMVRIVGVFAVAGTDTTRLGSKVAAANPDLERCVDPSLSETYIVVRNPSDLHLKYLLVWAVKSSGGAKAGTPDGTPASPLTSPTIPKGSDTEQVDNLAAPTEQEVPRRGWLARVVCSQWFVYAFFIALLAIAATDKRQFRRLLRSLRGGR